MINIGIASSTFDVNNTPIDGLFNFKLNKIGKRFNSEELIEFLKDCDGCIAGLEVYNEKVLSSLPNLKCISRVGSGTDNIDLNFVDLNKTGIITVTDFVTDSVAEHTMALILSLLKNICINNLNIKSGKWEKIYGRNLSEVTVGIIGCGRIGSKLKKLLEPYGTKILIYDKFIENPNLQNLNEIYEKSDLITIHVASQANYKFDLEALNKCKSGFYLVNTSRGKNVDENAIIYGLDIYKIAGVAMDVFDEEPYSGRLSQYPNTILTPHCATFTIEARNNIEKQAVSNLINWFIEKSQIPTN